MSEEIERWADQAMYKAKPMGSNIEVHLVHAHQDPLGAIAAASQMYEGKVVHDLRMVTNDQRVHYWEEMCKTKLTAPLEFVDLHFLISGVSRAFTHQMVRQRTAVYAQESLRFAVKEDFAHETPLPPSLVHLDPEDPKVVAWVAAMASAQENYSFLVNSGVPAEDARGLLPHATTTRLHYKTNLRNLVDHVGNRLCTQAQFEWKMVIFKMMASMRNYASFLVDEWSVQEQRRSVSHPPGTLLGSDQWAEDVENALMEDIDSVPTYQRLVSRASGESTNWQWNIITDPKYKWFAPACYAAGRCPFKADFDRGCTIRERADKGEFDKIEVKEWAADPSAAVIKPGGTA